MKRHSLLIPAILSMLLSFFASTSADCQAPGETAFELHYTVKPDRAARTVAVAASLTGLDRNIDDLVFSFHPGQSFLKLDEPLIDGPVGAFGPSGPLPIERLDPFNWTVEPSGEGEIRLEYVVPIRHRSLQKVRESHDAYEFPYLDDDHGMLTTWTLFAVPRLGEPARIAVTLEGYADGAEGCADGADVPWPRTGPATYEPPSLEVLTNDLIALGKWNRHTVRVGDFVGTVAIAPGQPDLERAAAEPIAKIVEAELALFGRPPSGRYLFLFGRPDASGAGGSPKANSMTLTVEPRLAARGVDFLPHLVAHEFHHTWTAGLFHAPDELRWYNEGFTDYFSYLVIARLGLTTWDEFAATLGGKMAECASNPHRGRLSLVDAGGKIFFADRDAYQLVYSGGLLTAAWLDCAIRSLGTGKKLDHLMRDFNNDRRWERGRRAPTVNDFVTAARAYIGEEKANELEAMVRTPFTFDPALAFEPLGVEIVSSIEAADMSLRANLDGVRVINLDPKGIAWQVGVRQGDRFVEINGQAVGNQIEVRKAWRAVKDNRIRLTFDRKEERLIVDEPLPRTKKFTVPLHPWRD